MDYLLAPLQAWFAGRADFASARPTRIEAFSGGASNITCLVDVTGAPFSHVVLRLQREEGIFAPYDVVREGRVLAALRGAPFPVPAVLASEPDPSYFGAPFLILEYIDGMHMGQPGVEADFGAYVRAVVDIHSLDWRQFNLEFLGVHHDAAAAIRAEVEGVAARLGRFGCAADPFLARALGRLRGSVPDDGEQRLCQGDINVFNYLFRDGRLVGVVDWEQARLSDPRGDVGQLVALSHLKGAPFGAPRDMPFVQLYEAYSGSAVHGLEWFRAFWLFQLAAIYHGWLAFNESVPWYTKDGVYSLLELALDEVG